MAAEEAEKSGSSSSSSLEFWLELAVVLLLLLLLLLVPIFVADVMLLEVVCRRTEPPLERIFLTMDRLDRLAAKLKLLILYIECCWLVGWLVVRLDSFGSDLINRVALQVL